MSNENLIHLEGVLKSIKSCTQPINGHPDPLSIIDCWNEVDDTIAKLKSEPRPPKNNSEDVYRWVKASERLPEKYERIPMRIVGNRDFVATGYYDGKVFWRSEDDKRNGYFDIQYVEWLEKIKPETK